MSETSVSLKRQIDTASDLQSVVRTMKASAAAAIGQYERSVTALADYYRAVELGLSVCFRQVPVAPNSTDDVAETRLVAIVFGSDQGLEGQFNDVVADFAIKSLAVLPGAPQVWAVGERVDARLQDGGLKPQGLLPAPTSVQAITSLVGQLQIQTAAGRDDEAAERLYIFHNRPTAETLYEPVSQRLLPLDSHWQHDLAKNAWPSKNLPEVFGTVSAALGELIREYLFISLFRGCAESMCSENASRLAAMQRADKNIDDLLADLRSKFRRTRQSGIDEELFDVISGFEALSPK